MIKDSLKFRKCLDDNRHETIVRQLMPKKMIEDDVEYGKCYRSFEISTSSQSNEYPNDNEMQILCHEICMKEDFMLIYGGIGYFKGLNELSTNFDGSLKDALRKYDPHRIIIPYDCDLGVGIPEDMKIKFFGLHDECYLLPEITRDIGEFIVTQDVYEYFKPCDYNYNTTDDFYGRYVFTEGVDIEIYKPEKFIKVQLTRRN